MLRVWNVVLVILTFFLTIFGTFLTRSGIVQSVHAFGQDPTLTWLFSIFMVILLTFSFGLVIYRLPLLRARNDLLEVRRELVTGQVTVAIHHRITPPQERYDLRTSEP